MSIIKEVDKSLNYVGFSDPRNNVVWMIQNQIYEW